MNLDTWFDQSSVLAANRVISPVLHHLKKGGLLIDVGANVGAVTAAALQHGGRVHAFEPHPVYADYLQRRCPGAIVHPHALGAEFGSATLYCDLGGNPGWNTMLAEMAEAEMAEEDVRVKPLDWFEFDAIDVLKIDVEGTETDVVEGGKHTIQRVMPVIVMELGWGTLHPDWEGQEQMMEWLFSIGYKRVEYEFEGTADVVLVPE